MASCREVERARDRAALYLSPPVEELGTMAFEKYEDIYRVGYECAKEHIAGWEP